MHSMTEGVPQNPTRKREEPFYLEKRMTCKRQGRAAMWLRGPAIGLACAYFFFIKLGTSGAKPRRLWLRGSCPSS